MSTVSSVSGLVGGVRLDVSGPVLRVGGVDVPLGSVSTVSG